jgi:Esterase FrsA-like
MSHVRNIDEIKAEVRKLAGKSKIFRRAKIEDVESVLGNLTSKDPELWAAEWSRVAKPYEDAGGRHDKAGRFEEARSAYLQAYVYYATGRYPVPHSAGKMECFRKSLELYEKAGRYFEPSLARIEIPYENTTIPAYVRLRGEGAKHPVVINFGGIDGFKAEAFEL